MRTFIFDLSIIPYFDNMESEVLLHFFFLFSKGQHCRIQKVLLAKMYPALILPPSFFNRALMLLSQFSVSTSQMTLQESSSLPPNKSTI